MTRLLFLLLFSSIANASVELGVGTTGATGGRIQPALAGGVTFSDRLAVSAFSTGVRTEVYYQSTYGVAAYRTWKSGTFFFGEVISGFGVGGFHSERGFKDTGPGDTRDIKKDFGIGPALRVQWMFLGPCYLDFQGTWGLTTIFENHLTFNFQDMISVSIGARFL